MRNLVEPVLPDNPAHARHTRVLPLGELRRRIVVCGHAAEFQHHERAAEHAHTGLAEYRRAFRFEPYRQAYQHAKRQGQRRKDNHGNDVEQPLEEAIEVVLRIVIKEVLIDMRQPDAPGQHFADAFHRIHSDVGKLEL
ncbi:hypothetical protein D3C87_1271900 [compost metagenome]